MRLNFVYWICLTLCAGPTFAEPPTVSESGQDLVDFDTEIVPVLTRFGCNSGACHGAAAGRRELHLSLFGSDPGFDFQSLAREFQGRRINLVQPDESLILMKPTEVLLHGGGNRFDDDSDAAELIRKWIHQGAHRHELRKLESFAIAHRKISNTLDSTTFSISATATFDNGSTMDVTPWTVITVDDPDAVQIDLQTFRAHITRPGRHVAIARYLDHVTPLIFLIPFQNETHETHSIESANFIDDSINSLLTELRIPASEASSDTEFLRRVTLDLTGRLPTPEEVLSFTHDSSPGKRTAAIDRMLASKEFASYWTFLLSRWLRIRAAPQDVEGAEAYHSWLHQQIADEIPFTEIAASLLLAEGDTHDVGPANFYRTTGGPREQAEFVSEFFMGSRLRCANCHDHPLDHWTQDDYHGLAAIFAEVTSGRIIETKANAEVIHPKTGDAAVPRIPGERTLQNAEHGRSTFTDWLVSDTNPYLARTIVNRVWKEFMGRGLIEPTDDIRSTNPPTHPELLKQLEIEFRRSNFRLKPLIRLITSSSAYQRSSRPHRDNEFDQQFYSHALSRPMSAEVMCDAISDVLGLPARFGDKPLGTRAVELPYPQIESKELDVLGRCERTESCEGSETMTGGLPRFLHQYNGALINTRLSHSTGRLADCLQSENSPEVIIEEFYLRALGRLPNDEEWNFWRDELKNSSNPREFLEDVVWSLCTCQEFRTNH
ncbi:hypothetical protein KOR42_12500 [Thalassoglobus neptunius]|uniref:Planctomycete cytochrome C n=1 Tax=Thalassoglobus neptunius TaxID=1938619 RepID=A0A5C5X6J2_9PLAN|nr:DUF1553 domain-containing protein [Thalassoglobus neptunius]TWT57883.1 hypothetical protein KOR42_12500 [Thalassoglobus neptunius]